MMVLVRWALALALGGFLILFGAMKFTGGAHIFPYIEYKAVAAGFPFADLFFPLLNHATGALEILAGALVILPATRALGSKISVLPLLGAVAFHLSPLLGVSTPDGYAAAKPVEALAAGGPFVRDHFSDATSPSLFTIAVVVLVAALANVFLQRD